MFLEKIHFGNERSLKLRFDETTRIVIYTYAYVEKDEHRGERREEREEGRGERRSRCKFPLTVPV